MFDYIKGLLTAASPTRATLEAHGIGYLLFIPFNNYSELPQIGALCTLYIAAVIREDSHKFYGFITTEQRDLFESLIDVSGVGPKTALALVGHMPVPDLHYAISHGNTALLSKIPGIGKKTAERLIVEMRDKMKKQAEYAPALGKTGESGLASDAISALIHLGYNPSQAQKALKAAIGPETPTDLGQLITAALRHI